MYALVMPDPQQPPKENLFDRLMTVGVWVVAVLAAVVVIWLAVFLVRWGLGDADVPLGALFLPPR